VHAVPDPLLEQIRALHADQGHAGARTVAQGLGILLREHQGQLLVPVIVDRSVERGRSFQAKLKQGGGRLDATSRSWARILVPVEKLEQLFSAFPGEHLRAPIPHSPASTGYGSIVSESVALTAADGYQVGNLTGSGVKVAVVDLGFTKLNDAITAGELPADALSHGMDFTGGGLQGGTKHGTGVAEHVADMAPGAEIHYLRVDDEVDLQNAADYIDSNNIHIANHSVSWVLSSYYDDTGPINDIINESVNTDGVFWTVAAGNSAPKHWRGNWLDADGDKKLEFVSGDELMQLTTGTGKITLFLNWDQYGAGSITNLDLYLVDDAGTVRASSTTGFGSIGINPYELIEYTYNAGEAPYHVRVQLGGGNAAGLDITLFSFNNNFEHSVAASSVLDPASSSGAFTVGAIKQDNWNNINPAIRTYSSQGPTTDGRLKPQLVGPDGTTSLTYGTSNGTSFAAPTVAGAAALLLQENSTLTPAGLANALQNQAIDIGTAGADNVFGYGQLQLALINSDSDQLNNVEEIALGTDPLDWDTDDDTLSDSAETGTYGTDPLLKDTDGDGLDDDYEIYTYGTDPLASNRGDLAPSGAPDGIISVGDVLLLSRFLLDDSITATAQEIILGDLNDSGGLDVGDLMIMMRVLHGDIPLP
jgi:subtilisin family serine protease